MKINIAQKQPKLFTHEGGAATRTNHVDELHRTAMTCMLWENTFYEEGSAIGKRLAELVRLVKPEEAAQCAVDARDKMNLRHVPLFILSELSKRKGCGPLVRQALAHVIQRADELTEFLAIYWKDGRHPLSAGVKKGLADAFPKFNAHQLAKYNTDGAVKLRDVLFLSHAKPTDDKQAAVWKKLVDGTLESPDTWEVELSAGKDKKATFERLMKEGKLGGLATLRNLRNMQGAGVDNDLIRARLREGCGRSFPYRFVVAAKYAPLLEDAIEESMLKAVAELDVIPGKTGLLIDVSGSMDCAVANVRNKAAMFMMATAQDTSRIDVACGLAILLREKAEECRVATFSSRVVEVAPRRGFALRDAIQKSQPHSATHLKKALTELKDKWQDLDRIIVITDEQSDDGIAAPYVPSSWVVNVASYTNGVAYRNGWNHIDGWSEYVVDYILNCEQ